MSLLRTPVILAPMAGGISTPELAIAAGRGEALSFLAGGYLPPEDLIEQIQQVGSVEDRFGVNLFVPPPASAVVANAVIEDYRELIQPTADRFGLDLRTATDLDAIRIDDSFDEKIDYLLAQPVPAVSFTFGLPGKEVLDALRQRQSVLIATVTNPAEAMQACLADVDVLCVQAASAGGHRSTFGNYAGSTLSLVELLRAVGDVANVPMIAAGGIAGPAQVHQALSAGAIAVQAGTAFLAATESGAAAVHKAALTAPGACTTVSRAFSGRPARGISNEFMLKYDFAAPAAYPQVNALTGPLRKAAAAANDPSAMSLWAGEGHRSARSVSAEQIAQELLHGL
jgi:nitronate monooxygenase